MRIALVSPYSWTYPGGVTRHIDALAHEFLGQGHHVRVLAPFDPPDRFSAALHRGLDGTKVTTNAQWRTVGDYQRMRERPDASPFLKEAMPIATFDPGTYEMVAVFSSEHA